MENTHLYPKSNIAKTRLQHGQNVLYSTSQSIVHLQYCTLQYSVQYSTVQYSV